MFRQPQSTADRPSWFLKALNVKPERIDFDVDGVEFTCGRGDGAINHQLSQTRACLWSRAIVKRPRQVAR